MSGDSSADTWNRNLNPRPLGLLQCLGWWRSLSELRHTVCSVPNCQSLWFSWGRFWFYRWKSIHSLQFSFSFRREGRRQSLLQNCACVHTCVCVCENMCLRESIVALCGVVKGAGLVCVCNEVWRLVSSANISSTRLSMQLASNRESSIAAWTALDVTFAQIILRVLPADLSHNHTLNENTFTCLIS